MTFERERKRRSKRERERRGGVSLKIAACHFFGTLIPLLFITKCQETIFSFNLLLLTPSEAVALLSYPDSEEESSDS